MQTTLLEKIRKETERLTPKEQLRLVEMVVHELRRNNIRYEEKEGKKSLDLTKLYGLGRGLWKGEDAQEYVSKLREDRV